MRYGYRRVHVLLQRESWRINIKKTHKIYNALGLQLRNKTPKRRVKAKLREDRCAATRPNETRAMDFVHDQWATGRNIRILTVVDNFSRFSPVIGPRFTYRSENLVEALDRACGRLGDPGQSGDRVRLPEPGPVGLCPRRHPGLLQARQAGQQSLH